jgi:hypothetical protein
MYIYIYILQSATTALNELGKSAESATVDQWDIFGKDVASLRSS